MHQIFEKFLLVKMLLFRPLRCAGATSRPTRSYQYSQW